MAPHSGIQKQVLALYRAVLREAAKQQEPSRSSIQAYARHSLEQNRWACQRICDSITLCQSLPDNPTCEAAKQQ